MATIGRGYRFVNHTADVEFIAVGATVKEALSNSILALFDTSFDIRAAKREKSRDYVVKIKSKSDNLPDLVWYTLQNSLSNAEARNLFCYSVRFLDVVSSDGGYAAKAELLCRRKSEDLSKMEVKAVSRYNLSAGKRNGRFEIRVVLDV